ncbi:MAG: archaeal proteasome endopeptidase complex subunit beta [Candidatus Wukongarchaeota archaeon]|nr:archaeal proteasome endopeptidase complex subunit beta [Candidatus Wukongarchaeota archaeon]
MAFFGGATAVGIAFKEGVVLAAEKRYTLGHLVQSKSAKKVFKINEYLGVACAGLISDMTILAKLIGAQASLFMLDNERQLPVEAAAKLMSNIMFNRRFFPYFTEVIIGGFEPEGSKIFVLDPIGSLIPDRYTTTGSGAPIAMGVLEDEYNEDLSLKEAKDLAVRAMIAALKRDSQSGNGVDLLIIDKKGVKEEYIKFES